MRSIIATLAALAAVAAASGTRAQTPPEGLVWMALNEINAEYFDRDDPTNRPPLATRVPDDMLRPVDVSPDGRTDWIVDFAAARSSRFCGTGGCARILYVSGGDTGFLRAFDAQALAFEVVERSGETRVEAMVHHLSCRPGRPECWYAWAWDPALGRLVERPARDGATRLEDGGFDPIDRMQADIPDSLPAELSRAWFGGRRTCRAPADDGIEILRPGFQSIPDVNGDGGRDWIETPAACPEDEAEAAGFRLWTTTPGGGLAEAYASEADLYPSVDIATVPATVLVNPPCGHGEACPDTPLRLDGRTGRFALSR
ncbi:hypothetical protein [Brevundimonas sp.]|uniref:hypothetical protein n=1 Tax=Brevundimonas sp. TaxID=1871086 RepID=UPI002737ED6B|nr:hypothetical protein [Brevundimonas sp.]MDP3801621.1 hypothetical protein [Brevundimonas sp.]